MRLSQLLPEIRRSRDSARDLTSGGCVLCHGVDAGLQGKLRRSVEAIVDGGALGFGVDELVGRGVRWIVELVV